MQISIAFLMAAAAAVQAANVVHQHVVYSTTGASDVVANGFGCAHITPPGAASQLGCIKHVFTDGFTVGVTDEKNKAVTLCSIAGTSGACGPLNINVDLTGGTGNAPPPSGPQGTTTLTPAELKNLPIAGSAAAAATTPAATNPAATTPAGTGAAKGAATPTTSCTDKAAKVTGRAFVA